MHDLECHPLLKRNIRDVNYSGDLHEGSVTARLLQQNGRSCFLKLNGESNYKFVSEVKGFLESITDLPIEDWFCLPEFSGFDGHLVTEDVEAGHATGGSVRDLSSWYRQAGTLLAFSTLVGLTDLHIENLITVKGRLYLIDVDTLFHPRLAKPNYPNLSTKRIDDDLHFSILTTGLMPFGNTMGNGSGPAMDVAGLVATEAVNSTSILRHVDGSDAHSCWAIQSVWLPKRKSRNIHPDVSDGRKSLYSHANQIRYAFRSVMDAVAERLDEFKTLLMTKSFDVRVRSLVRNTAAYSALISLAASPLSESRARAVRAIRQHAQGLDGRIVEEEISQVMRGHIPVFWWNAHEIPHGCEESPLNAHCGRLSEEWLHLQEELLEFFLMEKKALTVGGEWFSELLTRYRGGSDSLPILLKNLVGDAIESAICGDDGTISYAELSVDTADDIVAIAMGDKVYDGLSGVLLACVGLNEIDSSLVPWEFIDRILKSVRMFPSVRNFKGYYESSLAQLYQMRAEPSLVVAAADSHAGDFLSGKVGVLEWMERSRADEAVQTQLIDDVIDSLVECDDGSLSWSGRGDTSFASFAHGNSGVIFALSRRIRSTGPDQECAHAIRRLLQYEFDHLEQVEEGLYVDSRSGELPTPNWCHSVGGMLLTRVEVLSNPILRQWLDDHTVQRLERELRNQADWLDKNWGNTLAYGNCHGVAGNLAILHWVSKSMNLHVETDIAESFTRLLRWGRETHWGGTVGATVTHVGLMNGLWGVAYSAAYSTVKEPSEPPFWAVAGSPCKEMG